MRGDLLEMRKNVLLTGAYSFHLEKVSFQKDDKTILTELPPLKVYPFPLKFRISMDSSYGSVFNRLAPVSSD